MSYYKPNFTLFFQAKLCKCWRWVIPQLSGPEEEVLMTGLHITTTPLVLGLTGPPQYKQWRPERQTGRQAGRLTDRLQLTGRSCLPSSLHSHYFPNIRHRCVRLLWCISCSSVVYSNSITSVKYRQKGSALQEYLISFKMRI